MAFLFKNNAGSTLAAGINASQTTLSVQGGDGANFPAPSGGNTFRATITKASGAFEIVDVTAIAVDVFTIVRNQESSGAKTFLAGDRIELRVTEETLQEFAQINGGIVNANLNADQVDGIHAAAAVAPNVLLALNGSSKLPADITGDADTVDSIHANAAATANQLLALNGSGELPAPATSCSGNAATATLAADSSQLGAVAAASYARKDVAVAFAEDVTFVKNAKMTGVLMIVKGADVDAADDTVLLLDGNYVDVVGGEGAITGASKANPCVITAPAHGLVTGGKVTINDVLGMIELNGNLYTITFIDVNSFSLNSTDSTGFTAYVSGGRANLTVNGMTDGVLNEVRKFHFDGAFLFKHATAASAGFSSLWLPNAADYTTVANDELEFVYDGTYWRLSGSNFYSAVAIANGLSGAPNIQEAAMSAKSINRAAIRDAVTGSLIAIKAGTDKSTATATWTKTKEVRVPYGGTFSVYFFMTGSTSFSRGRIYKNGSAVGTARDVFGGTGSWTEDISGLVPGDLLQIYTKNDAAASTTINSFILYELQPLTFTELQ